MVEVARAPARPRRRRSQLHVVGDGELRGAVRDARRASWRSSDIVRFHPPTQRPRALVRGRRRAADDERVRGRALRRLRGDGDGRAVVAPALPGNAELMGEDERRAGRAARRRRRATPTRCAGSPSDARPPRAHRRAERVRGRSSAFSLELMADGHEALYERAARAGARRSRRRARAAARSQPAALRARPRGTEPLVSVVIPCFNHGRFLARVRRLDRARRRYPTSRSIVVDDASTERETPTALLDELEARRRRHA